MAEQSRLSKVFGGSVGGGGGSGTGGSIQKKSQPQAKQLGEVKQITIQMPTISIRIDEHFKAKLPFLLLMLLLFAFSLVLFEKSNFHTIDIVDIGRLQYNVSKLWSVSFVLFILLYSFSVALAMFYGFGQNWGSSLLVAVPTLAIAVVTALFYSGGYLLAFPAFALTLCAASLLASLRTQVKFSSVYSTAGTALLVLVVLSFFVAFTQISANKDAYIDAFISSGVTASVSQLQGGTQIESVVTEERVSAWIDGVPGLSIPQAQHDAVVKAVRAKAVTDLYASGGASPASAGGVRQALGNTPAFVAFYNNFALLSSLLIASFVAVFTFVIKLVSTLLCWLLAKL